MKIRPILRTKFWRERSTLNAKWRALNGSQWKWIQSLRLEETFTIRWHRCEPITLGTTNRGTFFQRISQFTSCKVVETVETETHSKPETILSKIKLQSPHFPCSKFVLDICCHRLAHRLNLVLHLRRDLCVCAAATSHYVAYYRAYPCVMSKLCVSTIAGKPKWRGPNGDGTYRTIWSSIPKHEQKHGRTHGGNGTNPKCFIDKQIQPTTK